MISNQKHISICGIGPGNPDYIPNLVFQKVAFADVIIGGKRQLSIFSKYNKKSYVFDGKVNNLKMNIQEIPDQNIAILVSGDTGFYSLRKFIVDAFPDCKIDITPGISSFQYFYAKLGLGYEHAHKTSLHGNNVDYLKEMDRYESIFLLTDKINNWKAIATKLNQNGFGNVTMHIGNRLSYKDESIITTTPLQAVTMDENFELCAVIIENPQAYNKSTFNLIR